MNLDLSSFAFGSELRSGSGTPSWGTSLGQSKPDYKFTYPGAESLLIGMIYCSVPLEKVKLPLGKGGRIYQASELDECQLASLFRKVYINGKKIDYPFIVVLVKENSDSHSGRKNIKYSDKNSYQSDNDIYTNQEFLKQARISLGLSEDACWFIYSFEVHNQDELHMKAVVVDKDKKITYSNSTERGRKWVELIPDDDKEAKDFFIKMKGDSCIRQQIFYGAPGTGKSFEINKKTKEHAVIRTTFHPDSDYSTFVGAYKPVMEECDVRVTPIVTNNGVSLQPSGTYKERRIAYKFVKQAFLKAYLAAWKKFTDAAVYSQPSKVKVMAPNGEYWILKEVENNRVYYTKIVPKSIEDFEKSVKNYWNRIANSNGSEILKDTWKLYEISIIMWYRDNYSQDINIDDCWNSFLQVLKEGKTIEAKPGTNQTYSFKLGGNKIIAISENNATRSNIKKSFENIKENSNSVDNTIAKKILDYNCSFDEAWNKLKQDVERSNASSINETNNYYSQQYLVIEEINRGNCAQIFGDLFQLLDRSDNGFSTYPIEADTDLQQEIARAFKEEDPYKLMQDIEIEGAVENYTSNYDASLSKDVQEGRVLLLPPNLYIWATMNTSDQSLFPIDSAFKRRWDWKYVPINEYEKTWYIKVDDDNYYSWSSFLHEINEKIGGEISSEDKKLGFFFCKATEKMSDADEEKTIITVDTFVSKVLFYIYNDVFKDYGLDNYSFFKGSKGVIKFQDYFASAADYNLGYITTFLDNLKVEKVAISNERKDNGTGMLKVTLSDGTVIDGTTSVEVFMNTVSKVVKEKGLQEVKDAKVNLSGINIIQDLGWISEKYPSSAQKNMENYIMFTHGANANKKTALESLSKNMGLGLKVEIV